MIDVERTLHDPDPELWRQTRLIYEIAIREPWPLLTTRYEEIYAALRWLISGDRKSRNSAWVAAEAEAAEAVKLRARITELEHQLDRAMQQRNRYRAVLEDVVQAMKPINPEEF